jgi:hypothetical protein
MIEINRWKRLDDSYVLDVDGKTMHIFKTQDACLSANGKIRYMIGVSENDPAISYSERPLHFAGYEIGDSMQPDTGEIVDDRLDSEDIEFLLDQKNRRFIFNVIPGLPDGYPFIYNAFINSLGQEKSLIATKNRL